MNDNKYNFWIELIQYAAKLIAYEIKYGDVETKDLPQPPKPPDPPQPPPDLP